MGVRGCFSNGWSLLVSEREPSDMCMHRDGLKKLCERTKGKPKHRGGLTVVYGHLRCACCPLLFLVEFNPCRVSVGNSTRTYLRTVVSPFVSTQNKRFKYLVICCRRTERFCRHKRVFFNPRWDTSLQLPTSILCHGL